MLRKSTNLAFLLIHFGAWLPLMWILYDYFTGNLSVNPIQDIEQRSGRTAITFLITSLACTPVNIVFRWRSALGYRRVLGLYAYFYAALHVMSFFILDYGGNIPLILQDVGTKRFIIIGAIAFIILTALALTSFNYWKKKLGKNWKRLHRLIYLAAPLATLHFGWARKGNLFQLQGDIIQPLFATLIIFLLLLLRLAPVRNALQLMHYKIRA